MLAILVFVNIVEFANIFWVDKIKYYIVFKEQNQIKVEKLCHFKKLRRGYCII
jgi:hypothetical protein